MLDAPWRWFHGGGPKCMRCKGTGFVRIFRSLNRAGGGTWVERPELPIPKLTASAKPSGCNPWWKKKRQPRVNIHSRGGISWGQQKKRSRILGNKYAAHVQFWPRWAKVDDSRALLLRIQQRYRSFFWVRVPVGYSLFHALGDRWSFEGWRCQSISPFVLATWLSLSEEPWLITCVLSETCLWKGNSFFCEQ